MKEKKKKTKKESEVKINPKKKTALLRVYLRNGPMFLVPVRAQRGLGKRKCTHIVTVVTLKGTY